MSARVASFDVFDTLLTRRVGDPDSVGLLLGRRLLACGAIPCSAEVFALQRRLADDRASDQAGGDPSLAQVHAELARALGLAEDAAEDLRRAEVELETELMLPVPGARELVRAARGRGERVVFVSDTNFTAHELRSLLERHQLSEPGDPCFSSSELGAAKHRGTLYPLVATELGVAPADIRHHGDDPRADLRHARGSGWQAVHLPRARLNRYERILERHRVASGGLGSALAGASRAARLAQPAGDTREQALVEVSAGVMGPMLATWMAGVLGQAQREGIGCLYFLSRDGEVMLDVARRVEDKLRTGVELRYLRGSRTTWLPAAAGSDADLQSFNLDRDFRSVRTVLASIGLQPEHAAGALPASLRERASWDEPLGDSARAQLDEALRGPAIRELVSARGAGLRELLVAYLRQENWDRAEPVALVDVGWRGRIVRALTDVCEREGLQRPARVFFYGVRHDAHGIVGDLAPALSGWFYDHAANTGFVRHMFDLEACVEMFCAADEGSVVDYARQDGAVRPVLGPGRDDLAAWGLAKVRRTVASFADALLLDPELLDLGADARAAIGEVMEAFWTRPSPGEVAAWSGFPLTIDMFHSRSVRMAEPIRLRRVAEAARRGRVQLRPDMSWPAGTARVSAPPYRVALAGRELLRRELPRVRRRARMTATAGLVEARRRVGRLVEDATR